MGSTEINPKDRQYTQLPERRLLAARNWNAWVRDNQQSIDAVITDQTMPNKSGIEIASVMLALRPELPIFLCSGYSDKIDEAGAQSFGIRRKPIKTSELLAALEEEVIHSAKL